MESVYIETSVVSYLVARPLARTVSHQWHVWTKDWWRLRRPHFECVISAEVLREAETLVLKDEPLTKRVSSVGQVMFKDHACVVLTKNLPDEGLEAGDVGTVAHIHKDGVAYEVEFVTLTGETVAVVTVEASHVRPLSRRDRAHTRELQAA